MSCKLITLTIALLGLFGSNLAGDCPDFCAPTRSGGTQMGLSPSVAAGPRNDVAAVAAADALKGVAAEPTDKELIEKQKTCPVTDQPLGSMGKPVKVTVKGRVVFLCCAACKPKLLNNPDKYLKKLDEKK